LIQPAGSDVSGLPQCSQSKGGNSLKDTLERVNPKTERDSFERYLVHLKHLAAFLSQYTKKTTGVDVGLETLYSARNRSDVAGVLFCQFNSVLPFPDDIFAAIVSFQVIEHVVSEQKWLTEIHRTLKPGGAFILTMPNRETRSYSFQPPLNPYHVREHDYRQLPSVLLSFFRTVELFGILGNQEIQSIEICRLRRYRTPIVAGKQILKRFLPGGIVSCAKRILTRDQSGCDISFDQSALKAKMERFSPNDLVC